MNSDDHNHRVLIVGDGEIDGAIKRLNLDKLKIASIEALPWRKPLKWRITAIRETPVEDRS